MDPIFDSLDSQVTNTVGAEASAAVLIRGIQAKVADAIASALAGGASPEALSKLTAFNASLKTATDDLAAAVAENNPPPPPNP